MSSIYTVTLNPAIDKSTSVNTLAPERKMKCTRPLFEPGGGGVNVARAIKKLGGEATALYLAGGYTGKFFTQLLSGEHVASEVVEISQHTRENLIVLDNSSNLQYRFGMPGPVIQEKEWKDLLHQVEQITHVEFIVASGSVPEGVPLDIFARIAAIAKKKNAKFIVDTSGEALKQAVEEGIFLMKPNLGELGSLIGKEEISQDMIEKAAKELITKNHCKAIVVSMGSAGAMLVTNDEATVITPPDVKRESTVGAGDSMVAGIVLSLSKQKSLLEAVHYGVACGTSATMNWGTQLCNLKDVEKIYAAMQKQIKN
ncbi:MAG TPA: hexose kinase [Puia sp.]|nr:hexose kinase [Puia sp.]